MSFISASLDRHAKLLMIFAFILIILLTGVVLRSKTKERTHRWDRNTTEPRRQEYLYRLLTNTTHSLIQMEIKARRLEENMRRIKERTADLLWKNKDKALWHILFKNISRHVSIRHEFHRHSGLNRILQDGDSDVERRRMIFQ